MQNKLDVFQHCDHNHNLKQNLMKGIFMRNSLSKKEECNYLNKYAETGGDDTDGSEHHEVGGAADQPLEVRVWRGRLAELDPEERPEQADGDNM